MLKRHFHIYLAIIALASFHFSGAQTVFKDEADLKKQANTLFEEENFAKAYPLFSQLLSLYPKDPQYNYKFGTCLMFASNDKQKAVPYIEYAAKRQNQGVDKEVFFYLGKAYHLNYRFQDAIKSYAAFKGIASSKAVVKYDVDHQIEMCESGKRLLKTVTDLSVLEKKDVSAEDFFRSYNLSEFNAKLIVKPEDLKSAMDKKKNDESVMYLAPDRNQIYYSSYGEDGKTGKDIYFVTRSSSGDLSKPTKLGPEINTKYDEDFAFLHPNGKTLYFCSKGHNSMGGYDIFRSDWNSSTQSWGKPVNMDFAINTPDDDFLFISDAEDKTAYFSSKRESPDGRITVYRIKMERRPLDMAIISGTLLKTVGDRMAKATITITKVLKDEVVGVFNTNAADGTYTLKVPNGGKFMLSVESSGFKKSSELIVVPIQEEIKPLKQEITLLNENGQDKIIVKNSFDAEVDSASMQAAIDLLRAKASLDVSPAEEEIKVEETNTVTPTQAKNDNKAANPGKITNDDIIGMAYQDAKETQKEANDLLRNSESAKELSREKNDLSIKKYNEAQEMMKTAETLTNPDEKLAMQDRSAATRKEAEVLSKEAATSLTLSNQMENQAAAKQQQADAELKYAKDLDNAIKTGASESKMNDLLARKEDLDKKNEQLDSSFPPDLSKEIAESQTQANKTMARYVDVQQDVEDLTSESTRLRTEASKTNNEGVKTNLISQAEEIEKDLDAKKREAETLQASAKQQQAKADSLKNSASMTASVLKEIEATNPAPVATNTTAATTTISAVAVQETNTVSPTPTPTENTTTETPAPIKTPYVDVFVERMHEAEKEPDELKREERLAVIYQEWTDSLDGQLAILKKQLDGTSTETYRNQIQTKIYELQSSVDDKRQKAADSRNKVDNIKLKQALAEASTVTPAATNTTTTTNPSPVETSTATASVSPENITGTSNIDAYFENKLKENSTISNEYEKKVKEQKLYEDWAASLYNESQRLKENGNNGRANDAVEASKAKQAQAIQAADEVTRIKAEKPDVVASANLEPAATNTTSTSKTENITSPANTNTLSTTAPETTAVATNTVAPTNPEINPAASNTVNAVQPVNTNTVSSSEYPIATSQDDKPLPLNPPPGVTYKTEYRNFVQRKNEADQTQKEADRQLLEAADAQKQADKQFSDSKALTDKISQTTDPNEMRNLQNLADILDRSALKNQRKADSLKALGQNSQAESRAKSVEADLYLQSIDKAAYEDISSATGYTTTVTASTNPPKTENTASKTSTEPVNTNTASATNPAISKTEPVNTNTVSINPVTTETANTNTVSTTETPTASKTENQVLPIKNETTTVTENTEPVKNESAASKNENAAQPVTNENTAAKTENTTQPVKNETTTSKTENTEPVRNETTASKTGNATEPVKNETGTAGNATNPTAMAASAEMIRYYDALFDKLDLSGATSYSSSKPIPVDAPMPEGLVFKVQIGAFRNPIPQDLFKGIKPVTAETTPGGLKRYTAGLFQKFSTANNAKQQVNGMGYRDAFVVAFFNGKRISMSEAMEKARTNGETIDPTLAAAAANSIVQTNVNPTATTNLANSTDVKTVAGIFYTIQIGVFSRPVSSRQLYDISPLNSERTDNGLIRYTTGRFDDEAKATRAKNSIVDKGIKDAFVIVYRDGKRIGLPQAKAMIESEGSGILSKDKQEYTFVPSDTTTSESSSKNLTTGNNLGITFRVQVGAFKEQVPIAIANRLLANSGRGIKTFRDDNGLLVYTVGEFMEYESANALKAQLVVNGLTDAFVIGFKDGKKITATAAQEMLKNR